MIHRQFTVAVLIAACASAASAAVAPDHVVQLDTTKYGTLDQNHESVNNGPVACGPTSVVNSFIFLQNSYGFTGLVGADPYDTVNTLGSPTYMDTKDPSGTNIGDLITGKRDYIADRGLSSYISIEGETHFELGIEGVADKTDPTWDFLFDQLKAGQDVEILINWWDGNQYTGSGHYVTVTGMTWTDASSTGTLSFIDPWGGVDLTGTLAMHGSFMQLTYSGGAATDPNDPDNPAHVGVADISAVVAESPIPEPASAALMLVGTLATITTRRRRLTTPA